MANSLKSQRSWVAPYVGAWIETLLTPESCIVSSVAPYVGAWIETAIEAATYFNVKVAPYVGAWIETSFEKSELRPSVSRTLRGCVD